MHQLPAKSLAPGRVAGDDVEQAGPAMLHDGQAGSDHGAVVPDNQGCMWQQGILQALQMARTVQRR